VPKKYLLLLDQTILLHFRSSIDRPLNLPQYPENTNTVKVFFGARGVKFLDKRRENVQILQALR
jgi:hypothetical protein